MRFPMTVCCAGLLTGALCLGLAPNAAAQGSAIVDGGSGLDYRFLELQKVLHAAMDKVGPSTVTVQTFGGTRKVAGPKWKPKPTAKPEGKKPKGRPSLGMRGFAQSQGATTGIVLSADGWILVSLFALSYDPTTILITLPDGRSFNAVRKGEDVSRQIALVKIEATDLPVPEFLPPAAAKIGQWAFVLGRTFSATDPSVHMGVVSATRRIFGRAIQIDAYTSPANYGGPVVDIEGRIMGIAVPMDASGRKANVGLYDSGIGFAATIDDIKPLLARMQQGEVLHRGFLGVATDPAFLGPGAKLAAVTKNSVAYRAKIRKGHIVTQVDGIQIANSFHLQMLVGKKMAGDPVHLRVKVKYKGKDDEEFGTTVFLEKVSTAQMQAKKEEDLPPPWEKKDDGKK